jgi:hypothetical protein
MLRQFICWLWRGHDKRRTGKRYLTLECDYFWTCIRCGRSGISSSPPPKLYNEHESTKPKLNIVKFNKHD